MIAMAPSPMAWTTANCQLPTVKTPTPQLRTVLLQLFHSDILELDPHRLAGMQLQGHDHHVVPVIEFEQLFEPGLINQTRRVGFLAVRFPDCLFSHQAKSAALAP